MSRKLVEQGICSTCVYRAGCLSFKNGTKEGRPVWCCEQFDGGSDIEPGKMVKLRAPLATLPRFTMKNLIPGWESS